MLNDLYGFFRRNITKMNTYQLRKDLKEINNIKIMLETKLKELEGM